MLIRTGSISERWLIFRHELNQQDAPSPNWICRWVRWREEGFVTCKKPPCRPSSVCTPKNIARVFASVGQSPRRSAPKHAPALGMTDRSVRRTLHAALNLHPYKLQIMRSLSDQDKEVCLKFCYQFQWCGMASLFTRPNSTWLFSVGLFKK
jgi:hypothetical protein